MEKRLNEHSEGLGSKYTAKRLPVSLVYFEQYPRIDFAFYREKQLKGWSRAKKEALISGNLDKLSLLSRNYSQFGKCLDDLKKE